MLATSTLTRIVKPYRKDLVVIANLSRQIVEQGRLKQELNSDLLAVYDIAPRRVLASIYLHTGEKYQSLLLVSYFYTFTRATRWLFIVLNVSSRPARLNR